MSNIIRTNCPRDCYDGCGIVVELRDGSKPRVLGDPEHPVSKGRLCSKCAIAYNGVWQDDDARLNFPLKRIGKKGEAKFERVSWDTAFAEISQNLSQIIEQDGASSIIHTHYSGTLSLMAYQFPNRFFNYLGASEVDPDSICNAAGHVAWHILYGNSVMGFDPRTAKDAECIIVWGANPSHSAPHAHEHWLTESPAKIVVIDPIRSDTAKAADKHLQLQPGSDAALAFGLLHVLQTLGAFDDEYIRTSTLGAEEIMPAIAAATPQWTAQQTGLSAEDIIEVAKLYAAGPSMLWCGQGLQRQPRGGNIMRAVGLLPALTGNIGKPGTGFCYLNYTPAFAGIDLESLAGVALCTNPGKTVSHMDLASRLGDSNEFKALFAWNTNPLVSAPRQRQLRAAFAREDLFTVAVDCFPTDTTAYADIVLPAASFLEFDDITFSYFHLHMGAQAQVNQPTGESLPNQEIFRRLARAMGYTESALFENDETLLARMMSQMNTEFDFDGLKKRGHFYISEEPMLMHAEGKFETPSGKIEIASAAAEEMGLPRVPQAEVDQLPENGRLRLITPASKWRMNDSYANDPHIIEQSGSASVQIHPDDAAAAGVSNGSKVRLHNETGEIELIAQLDESVLVGTAVAYKGRWPSIEGSGANVNFVHTPLKADMGESTSVHATEVNISPV
jgi:anaerobic selenocysteine-containing dehydrogenase